jgi:TPR repeat protein
MLERQFIRGFRGAIAAILLLAFAPGCVAADAFTVAALERDVERGDVRAMLQLASRYEFGEGVDKSFMQSNYLYCTAAQRGDAEALYKLGWIYANGRGVVRDHAIASGLFALAAAQGHERSKDLLQYMKEKLKVSSSSQVPVCVRPEAPLALRLSRDLLPARAVAPEGKDAR